MASFVGSATSTGGTIDISSTGRAAGDRCIIYNYAAKFSSIPASVTPGSFNAIAGASGSFNNVGVGVGVRFNSWWFDLAGTETTLSLMTDGFQFDAIAFIFRPGSGETIGVPQNVVGEVTFTPPPSQPKTVSPGTTVGIVMGAISTTDGDDLVMSPAYTSHVFDGSQLGAGYTIYASGAGSTTVAGTIGTGAAAVVGFFQAVTSGGTPKVTNLTDLPRTLLNSTALRSVSEARGSRLQGMPTPPTPPVKFFLDLPPPPASPWVAIRAQFDQHATAIYQPTPPLPSIKSGHPNPVLRTDPWVAIRSQSDQVAKRIYQPTPPLPGIKSGHPNPVLALSPLVAINSQEWLVATTIYQPTPPLPQVKSAQDLPAPKLDSRAAIASQSSVQSIMPPQTVVSTPFVQSATTSAPAPPSSLVAVNSQILVQTVQPPAAPTATPFVQSAIAPAPIPMNPWAAINSQSWIVVQMPPVSTVFPPGQQLIAGVASRASQWAAITAQANVEGDFTPLLPITPVVPVQPFQGAGNSMGVGRKKKKKEIIREAVEEAYQRVIAEKPDISSASILKLVATAPEVKSLDNVRLAQIVAVLEILAAERDEDDAVTLLLLS